MKQGQIVRYVGDAHRAAGMEGIVIGLGSRDGAGSQAYLVRLPWARAPETIEAWPWELRKLRWFTKSFARKYPVDSFAHEWGAMRPAASSRSSRRSRSPRR
jgi:hypothetical protein